MSVAGFDVGRPGHVWSASGAKKNMHDLLQHRDVMLRLGVEHAHLMLQPELLIDACACLAGTAHRATAVLRPLTVRAIRAIMGRVGGGCRNDDDDAEAWCVLL